MIDESKLDYDPKRERLTYRSGISGKTVLAGEIGRELSKIGRAGNWKNLAVTSVAVDFADRHAAEHNADACKFLGLECEHNGAVYRSTAKFTPRKDFGIR